MRLIVVFVKFIIRWIIEASRQEQPAHRDQGFPRRQVLQAPAAPPDRRNLDLEAADLPYFRRQYLLSHGEMAFYRVFRLSLPPGCVAFAKVRLAALINCLEDVWRSGGSRIIGDGEATAMLSRPYRDPWKLPEV
jgi:hypothetical protein